MPSLNPWPGQPSGCITWLHNIDEVEVPGHTGGVVRGEARLSECAPAEAGRIRVYGGTLTSDPLRLVYLFILFVHERAPVTFRHLPSSTPPAPAASASGSGSSGVPVRFFGKNDRRSSARSGIRHVSRWPSRAPRKNPFPRKPSPGWWRNVRFRKQR